MKNTEYEVTINISKLAQDYSELTTGEGHARYNSVERMVKAIQMQPCCESVRTISRQTYETLFDEIVLYLRRVEPEELADFALNYQVSNHIIH